MRPFDEYVRSILKNCNYIWNPSTCQDSDLIEGVQRTFTMCVFKKCVIFRLEYQDLMFPLYRANLKRCCFIDLLCFVLFLINLSPIIFYLTFSLLHIISIIMVININCLSHFITQIFVKIVYLLNVYFHEIDYF